MYPAWTAFHHAVSCLSSVKSRAARAQARATCSSSRVAHGTTLLLHYTEWHFVFPRASNAFGRDLIQIEHIAFAWTTFRHPASCLSSAEARAGRAQLRATCSRHRCRCCRFMECVSPCRTNCVDTFSQLAIQTRSCNITRAIRSDQVESKLL